MTETMSGALDRITGFMQAWDQGEIIASSVSHGGGRQDLVWHDLAEAHEVLAAASVECALCEDVISLHVHPWTTNRTGARVHLHCPTLA